jgi:acetyltransferase-like isoleucine patch superfamily enzyme
VTRIFSNLLNRLAFVSPGVSSVRPRLQKWRGGTMGKNVWLGQYVYIDDVHPAALSIGDNCTVGIRSTILTHFYWGPKQSASNGHVIIEDNVFIGPHCVILPNVRIGAGAVIKAGTVVSRNVPAGTFWGAPSAEALHLSSLLLTKVVHPRSTVSCPAWAFTGPVTTNPRR